MYEIFTLSLVTLAFLYLAFRLISQAIAKKKPTCSGCGCIDKRAQ